MVDDAAPAAFICEEANMEGALKKKLWKTISYLLFLDYAAEEDKRRSLESLGHNYNCTETECTVNCKVALAKSGHSSACTDKSCSIQCTVKLRSAGHSEGCTSDECMQGCPSLILLFHHLGHNEYCTVEDCSDNCRAALRREGHSEECTQESCDINCKVVKIHQCFVNTWLHFSFCKVFEERQLEKEETVDAVVDQHDEAFRKKGASKRPRGNPEETITEEPKEKKSRKNGSVEDNAKSKATDRDVDQSLRKALR